MDKLPGLFLAVGGVVSAILAFRILRPLGVPLKTYLDLIIGGTIGALLMAKGMGLVRAFAAGEGELGRAILDWPRVGSVFYVAVGAVVGTALAARWRRLPVGRVLDGVVAAAPVSLVFGKAGCFLRGCCFGGPCASPPGVTLSRESSTFAHQVSRGLVTSDAPAPLPVHPLPLYEIMFAVLLLSGLLWLRSRRPWAGLLAAVGIGSYSLFRIGIDLLRIDRGPIWIYSISENQLVAGVVFSVCVILILTRQCPKVSHPPE